MTSFPSTGEHRHAHPWRSKYGGLEASQLKKVKEMEDKNRRLKGLVADLTLDKQLLQEVLGGRIAKSAERKRAAAWLIRNKKVSQRRSCGLMGLDRSDVRLQEPA